MSEHIRQDDLVALVQGAFVASNTSEHNAWSVAEALVQAEVDGQKGHGLSRIASYTAQARAGKVDGHALPQVEQRRSGSLMIDAMNGFAYPALQMAVDQLPHCAEQNGIAAASITRSHHCGVLGWHVERLANKGLVCIAFANTPEAMAPWGGSRRLFGTNPIAFAAPQRDGLPIVVDLALSRVARGKILSASQKGEAIPEGWATDSTGKPTTDANEALKGTLLPIGEAKGAALAFMVETLAVALTGASFSFEASSFFDAEGGPPNVGQFLVAIQPEGFSGAESYFNRFATLTAAFDDDPNARLPGSRRFAQRKAAERDGIEVDDETLKAIHALCRPT